MAQKRGKFDESRFVRDYVIGGLTQAQLAAKHRLSSSQVGRILRGQRRPDVLRRMKEAMAAQNCRTESQLARLQPKAVATLAKAMQGKASSVALSAAKEVLNRTLDDRQAAARSRAGETPPAPRPGLIEQLSPETKRRVLAELDGPDE
jgi:hypothetical protein